MTCLYTTPWSIVLGNLAALEAVARQLAMSMMNDSHDFDFQQLRYRGQRLKRSPGDVLYAQYDHGVTLSLRMILYVLH